MSEESDPPVGGDALAGWSALHGGIAPSAPVRAWLWLVQGLSAGPVSRVPPDLLSLAGVLAAAAAWGAAAAGGRWPLVSALLVVATGVLDGLDGAVALRTGRARPLGAVVDATADRIGDLLFLGVLAALGAPLGWVLVAGTLALLHEYVRARAQAVGMPGVGAVTVAERPTRVIVVAVAAFGTGALPAGTPLTGWSWATVCVMLWTVAGVVGACQLVAGILRSMPGRGARRGPGR